MSGYPKNAADYERYAVIAVTSIYGVDILQDNVDECRDRIPQTSFRYRDYGNDLADREDEVSGKRRKLLTDLDGRMIKQTNHSDVFTVEWQIV